MTINSKEFLEEYAKKIRLSSFDASKTLRYICLEDGIPFDAFIWRDLILEFTFFLFHITDRNAFGHITEDSRSTLMTTIEELTFRELASQWHENQPDEQNKFKEEYWGKFINRMDEYSSYTIQSPGEQVTKKGNLFWEFAKNIAKLLSGGPDIILVTAAFEEVIICLKKIDIGAFLDKYKEICQDTCESSDKNTTEKAIKNIETIIEDMKNYEFKKEEWIDDSNPIVKEEFEKIWDTFAHTANNEGELDNLMEVRNPIVFEALYDAAEKILSVMSPRNSEHIMQEVLEGRWAWFIEEYLDAMRTGYYIKLVKEKIDSDGIIKTAGYKIQLSSFLDKILKPKIYKPSSLEYSLCEYYSQTIRHALSEEKQELSKEQLDEIKYHIFVAAMYGLNAYAIEDMWKEI